LEDDSFDEDDEDESPPESDFFEDSDEEPDSGLPSAHAGFFLP